ncbi:hypothetical protein HHK36_001329 [Tetracentron sinense]|uniref:DNA-directed RNA polymerase II subunit RPB9-like zinc ribbon domain-containing protein n=1 Tax=Tetracentron sinense TaxID=13715 RepID=A0A834ZXF4_TETSI|nr:hypothetical protein HHK36_001329 [Tetracentron sinense]
MEFCPTCGNMLKFELANESRYARLFCPTCPYVCSIETKVKIKKKQHLQPVHIATLGRPSSISFKPDQPTSLCRHFTGAAMKIADGSGAKTKYAFMLLIYMLIPSVLDVQASHCNTACFVLQLPLI